MSLSFYLVYRLQCLSFLTIFSQVFLSLSFSISMKCLSFYLVYRLQCLSFLTIFSQVFLSLFLFLYQSNVFIFLPCLSLAMFIFSHFSLLTTISCLSFFLFLSIKCLNVSFLPISLWPSQLSLLIFFSFHLQVPPSIFKLSYHFGFLRQKHLFISSSRSISFNETTQFQKYLNPPPRMEQKINIFRRRRFVSKGKGLKLCKYGVEALV